MHVVNIIMSVQRLARILPVNKCLMVSFLKITLYAETVAEQITVATM